MKYWIQTQDYPNAAYTVQNLIHILLGIVCVGLLPGAQAVVPPPNGSDPGANTFEVAGAAIHETWAMDSQAALRFPNTSEVPEIETVSSVPSTRSSFMASWGNVPGASGYLLDVSTSSLFSDYVNGYHDLDVGKVKGRVVTGLNPDTTYYYRVRPYTSSGQGSYSGAITATTLPATGLIIHATFDSSITGNSNAAAIEAMINRAISMYESLFSDPITIEIFFLYATTRPDGTPMPAGTLSASNLVVYMAPWDLAINSLRADAKTSNDTLAIASLPGTALSANIVAASANARAVGGNAPPAMFADGTVGPGGPYDGIVTLNSSAPYQFTRPTDGGSFDAQRSTEHEIDEVIGLISHLGTSLNDLLFQDVFNWSSPGVRNLTSSGMRYFSIDGGNTNIVNFNQDPSGDFGDWLSEGCPQANPYVQNAFICQGQFSDIAATTPEGINLDVIGYDLVAAHPPFFTNEVSLGNGVYYLQFPNSTPFGYYSYLSDPRFIYHFDMGYEYWFDANDGHSGIYFYDFASNHFFYTSPSFPFPYLYDFSLNAVLYYYPDTQRPGHYTTNPRYFYNFATGQIITM